jgi:hypothetical protein
MAKATNRSAPASLYEHSNAGQSGWRWRIGARISIQDERRIVKLSIRILQLALFSTALPALFGQPSASQSTVTASPAGVPADGVTSATITVTLKTASGSPVSGKTVTLQQTGNTTISAASGPSDSNGVVTFAVTSMNSGWVVYTATDITDSVVIKQGVVVAFSSLQASASQSTVSASRASVTADGVSSSTITVTLMSASGVPVSGHRVTLAQGAGHSTISTASGASSANGIVTFTVTDATAEAVTYTATDVNYGLVVTQTAGVMFVTNGPFISSLSPTYGPAGTSVTISGVNFGSSQGSSAVTFGSTGFGYSRLLTVDHTKCGNSDSSNFPVLVSASDTTLKDSSHGGRVQKPDGSDILFYSDAGALAQMASEIESYDNVNGTVVAWVQIPTLSHTANTTFYMFYGTAAPPLRITNPWDSNYKGVWHLSNATTLSAKDSTTNGNNGTISSPVPGVGKIGGGAVFSGATDKIGISGLMGSPAAITLSGWVKKTSLNTTENGMMAIGTVQGSGGAAGVVYIRLNNDSGNGIRAGYYGAVQGNDIYGPNINDSNWHHIAYIASPVNSFQALYYDGNLVGSAGSSWAIDYSLGGNTTLGTTAYAASLQGALDEIHISAAARSADWVTTEYNNQNSPGNIGSPGFLIWGSEVPMVLRSTPGP